MANTDLDNKDKTVIPTNFGNVVIPAPASQKANNDFFVNADNNINEVNNLNQVEDPRMIYAKAFVWLGESHINPFLLFVVGFALVVLASIWGTHSDIIGYVVGMVGVIIFLAGAVKIYITSKNKALVIVGILVFFIAVIILSSIIFK